MPYHTWNSTFCFTQKYNLRLPFHTNHGKAENWASYHSVMPLVRSNCEKSTITCWQEQNFKIQSVIHTIAEMWQPQRAIHCFFAIHVWNDSIFQHWTIINWSWKCRGSCICLTQGFFFLCMKWKVPVYQKSYHANVLSLPCVEHLVIFHCHIQLPGFYFLKWHVEFKPVMKQFQTSAQLLCLWVQRCHVDNQKSKPLYVYFADVRWILWAYFSLKTGLSDLFLTCVFLRCIQDCSGSKYRRT